MSLFRPLCSRGSLRLCLSPSLARLPLPIAAPRVANVSVLRALGLSPGLGRTSLLHTSAVSRCQPPSTPPPAGKPGLSEDIMTIPNVLTMSRLLLTPYIGHLVLSHQFSAACVWLFVAGVSDLLDGWIARRTGRFTVFGSIADPAADKALMTTMVITLGLSGMMPLPLMGLILARDLALVASAFVIRYKTLAAPKTLARYFDPRLPSATVTPTQLSKYNTFLQLLLVGILTLLPVVFPDDEPSETKENVDKAVRVFMWIVVATTVWSGVGYLGGAGTRRVLAQKTK